MTDRMTAAHYAAQVIANKKRKHPESDIQRAIVKHLAGIAPTWTLLPWDFAANVYFGGVAAWCSDIVPIGRVKWIPGSPSAGVDNCAWYRLDAQNRHPATVRARA